jgi:hypothetical protein
MVFDKMPCDPIYKEGKKLKEKRWGLGIIVCGYDF